MPKDVLGIDMGGVIIDRMNDGTDTSFLGDNYLNTKAVKDAFASIRQLIDIRFWDEEAPRVHLVSRSGSRVSYRSRRWLDHHRFYDVTGIPGDHLHFCKERADKAAICERLGITHFIDDRLEVLSHLTMVGNLYLFQGRPNEFSGFEETLKRVCQVSSWSHVVEEMTKEES